VDATPEDRLEELFEAALAVAPELRAAFLDDACADDAELRGRLAQLVADAARAYEFVDRVARPAIDRCVDGVLGDASPRIEDSHVPRVGKEFGHFRVLERLGGGGMGVVYKAIDVRLGTAVAVKFLPARSSANDEARRRFIQEAKAASALDHPNICAIHEIGETDDGELYIAMAYYDGPSLKEKIGSGPLPVTDALTHFADVAEGLRSAHEARIVHRDIKPANVMIGERGRVKIVDFGLAKMSGADLTREPRAMGTIAYMSPEQTYGTGVDRRTDIWSLGVLLYEMLTGRRPFSGGTPWRLIHAIRYSEPIPIRELRSETPPSVAALASRCLEKHPSNRYQSVNELLAAIRAAERDGSSSRGEPRLWGLLGKIGLRD
jgi:eukaryotic-like serine/threonine-protein kinase